MIVVAIKPRAGMNVILECLRAEVSEYERMMLEQALMQTEIVEQVELPMDEKPGTLSEGSKQFGGRACIQTKRQLFGHLIPWYTSGFE